MKKENDQAHPISKYQYNRHSEVVKQWSGANNIAANMHRTLDPHRHAQEPQAGPPSQQTTTIASSSVCVWVTASTRLYTTIIPLPYMEMVYIATNYGNMLHLIPQCVGVGMCGDVHERV